MTTDESNEKERDDRQRMRDVNHTPPDGDGARAVWERGGEAFPDDEKREESAETDRERVGVADE